jgi:hypothetical protein
MGAILSVSDYEKKKEAYVNTMTKVEKYEILARENKALGKALEETLLVFLNQLDDPIKKEEELEQIKEIQKRIKDAGEKEAVEELMKETTAEPESTEAEASEEIKEEEGLTGGKRRRKRRSYRTMKKIIRNRY